MKTTHELSKAIQNLHNIKMAGIKKAADAEYTDMIVIVAVFVAAALSALILF